MRDLPPHRPTPTRTTTSRRDQAMVLKSTTLLLTFLSAQILSISISGCGAFIIAPATSTCSSCGSGYAPSLWPACSSTQGFAIMGTSRLSKKSSRSNRIRPMSRTLNTSRTRIDLSLPMGIRSFITRKILRKGGDDDDDENGSENDVTLHSILQSPGSAGLMESANIVDDDDSDTDRYGKRKGGTTTSELGKSDADTSPIARKNQPEYDEAIKERIRRMKGGGMTEEEKAQFLNNALTQSSPKKLKPKGPPIRQKIPGLDNDATSSSGKRKRDSGSSRSSSAKENLWNALTKKDSHKESGKGGGSSSAGDISVVSLMMDGKSKSEEAKRKYMESIMSPDRFSTFSTYQQSISTSSKSELNAVDDGDSIEVNNNNEESSRAAADLDTAEEMDEVDDGFASNAVTGGSNFAQMKRQIEEDRALLKLNDKPEQTAARDAVESILSLISSNNSKKVSSTSVDTSAVSPPVRSTDHLAARLGQAAEEQEKRDAELRIAAEKKREDEKRKFAELQRQRDEDARRKEEERIEKARKIAEEGRRKQEEKAAAERADLEARQARQDDYWAKMLEKERVRKESSEPIEMKRKKEVIVRDSEERLEREVAKDALRERVREEERAREDPHEGEILKEAAEEKLRDRERVRDIETISAARVSRTVPRPVKEDVSVSSFVREQQKKKEEIDRLRQLDLQSLKSLNSPLPSPGRAPVGMPPSPLRSPPAKPAVPAPVRKATPNSSLSSQSISASRISGAQSASISSPLPSSPSKTPPINLFEMTKLKQDSATSTNTKDTSSQKRVVRQQTPLSSRSSSGGDDDDDDDDDDENLMRSGAPGLTVADALMKQRKKGGGNNTGEKQGLSAEDKAKQWGIDMSRFK